MTQFAYKSPRKKFGKIGWLNTGNTSVIKQPFAKGVTFPWLPQIFVSLRIFFFLRDSKIA